MRLIQKPDYYSEIRRLTLVGGVLDLFLGILKVVAGYIGNSQALIADGIHSLSDLVTGVLFATKQSSLAADEGHPCGPTDQRF